MDTCSSVFMKSSLMSIERYIIRIEYIEVDSLGFQGERELMGGAMVVIT